jgi:hypothetical protein
MVRAMIAAPAHGVYDTPCAGAGMITLTIPPTHNNVPYKIHILHVQELLS